MSFIKITSVVCLLYLMSQVAGAVTATSNGITIRTVTDLDSGEPYEAHLFHDGYLWVGRNRKDNGNNFYRLEAYNAQGTAMVASAMLKHTLGFIYPYGAHDVIVVGKAYTEPDGWRTYFSVGHLQSGRLSTRTTPLPLEVQTEQYAGTVDNMFFTETGDAAVFRYSSSGTHFLAPRISGPGQMLLIGNSLFVIERNSFAPGDENLVKINLSNETAERTFQAKRNNLSAILDLKGYGKIAASETFADQVLLVDTNTNKLVETIAVKGNPRGLARLGKCLLSLALFTKQLHFFDISQSPAKEIDQWDLTGLGDKFKNIRNLEVDPQSGRIFIRATFRPELPDAIAGVMLAEQSSGETLRKCTQ